MDLDYDVKPYAKIITIGANLGTSIELRDSAGNLMGCDFVQVVPSDVSVVFSVIPSSQSARFYSGTLLPSGATTAAGATASGAGGAVHVGEKIVLRIANGGIKMNAVTVYNHSAASHSFLITYGSTAPVNKLRLRDRGYFDGGA